MSKEQENDTNSSLEKIDITTIIDDYVQLLIKRWRQVIFFVLVSSVVFTLYTQVQYKPVYTASSTYAIYLSGDNTSTYYDNTTAQQMAKSFPYILTSGLLQRRVAESLGESSVPGKINASVEENTNFLVLSVSDSDAKRAYDTLNSVIKNYPEISERIVGKVNMELLDETGFPMQPDNPRNIKKNIAIGGLTGLIISFLYLSFLLFGRKTIRREEDCKKRINMRCLGEIPQMSRKERSHKEEYHPMVLQKNIDSEFVEAFQLVQKKVEHELNKNKAKSILITSTLPGEGKSTVVTNLALTLAKSGKKVTLIDCDLRNPSDLEIFGIESEQGLIDYLMGNAILEDCLLQGKDIVSDNIPFLLVKGGKAVKDGASYLSDKKIKNLIKYLEGQMDYVLIDTPPVGIITDASIVAQYVEGAVFVVRKDHATATHIIEAVEHLSDSNVKVLGCVLNGK